MTLLVALSSSAWMPRRFASTVAPVQGVAMRRIWYSTQVASTLAPLVTPAPNAAPVSSPTVMSLPETTVTCITRLRNGPIAA